MPNDNGGLARFDGTAWELWLPLNAAGRLRLLQLGKVAGVSKLDKLTQRSLFALAYYLTKIQPQGQLFAQLSNSFERFTFHDDELLPMFAETAKQADKPGTYRFGPKTHTLLCSISKVAKCTHVEAVRMAFLFYEWYVMKIITGHVLRVGNLGVIDEPKLEF